MHEDRYILRFCAIEVNVCQIGTPLGTSNTFPNSGSPFGPGGSGGLDLSRRHFQINARVATPQSDAA